MSNCKTISQFAFLSDLDNQILHQRFNKFTSCNHRIFFKQMCNKQVYRYFLHLLCFSGLEFVIFFFDVLRVIYLEILNITLWDIQCIPSNVSVLYVTIGIALGN